MRCSACVFAHAFVFALMACSWSTDPHLGDTINVHGGENSQKQPSNPGLGNNNMLFDLESDSDCDLVAINAKMHSEYTATEYAYCLVFGKKPAQAETTANDSDYNSWVRIIAGNMNLRRQMIVSMVGSPNFQKQYATDLMATEQLIKLLYNVLLLRNADAKGLNDYIDWIEKDNKTIDDVVFDMVRSVEFNQKHPLLNSSQDEIFNQGRNELLGRLKHHGCMFHSLLFPYIGAQDEYIELLRRSQCQALPRVIETWSEPPDFTYVSLQVNRIANAIPNRTFDYGMFIAERLGTKNTYVDDTNKEAPLPFNFRAMCKSSSEGDWGKDSCTADLTSEEYRRYVLFIIRNGINHGIRNFLFGQLKKTDSTQTGLPTLAAAIRKMARTMNVEILLGGQTGNNDNALYLSSLDYIQGGFYFDKDGNIEMAINSKGFIVADSQECWSLRNKPGFCQALLWHPRFSKPVMKNAIIELDWWDFPVHDANLDDVNRFVDLLPERRHKVLRDHYNILLNNRIGMVMPFRLPIMNYEISNPGCHGEKPWIYSASSNYKCQDEDTINAILSQTGVINVWEY